MLEGEMMSEAVVEVRAVPALRVLSVRGVVPKGGSIPARFDEVMAGMEGFPDWAQMGPCVAYYYGDPEQDMEVEIGFIAPAGYASSYAMTNGETMTVRDVPAQPAVACLIHTGSYAQIGEAWHRLMAWMGANGYRMCDACSEVYLNDPDRVPEAELLTELRLPVEKV
jgi:effector-binding domain-containing protein